MTIMSTGSTGSGLASKGGKGVKRPYEEPASDSDSEDIESVTDSIPDPESAEESDTDGESEILPYIIIRPISWFKLDD